MHWTELNRLPGIVTNCRHADASSDGRTIFAEVTKTSVEFTVVYLGYPIGIQIKQRLCDINMPFRNG